MSDQATDEPGELDDRPRHSQSGRRPMVADRGGSRLAWWSFGRSRPHGWASGARAGVPGHAAAVAGTRSVSSGGRLVVSPTPQRSAKVRSARRRTADRWCGAGRPARLPAGSAKNASRSPSTALDDGNGVNRRRLRRRSGHSADDASSVRRRLAFDVGAQVDAAGLRPTCCARSLGVGDRGRRSSSSPTTWRSSTRTPPTP